MKDKSFISVDLGQLEETVSNTLETISDGANTLINNTMDDISSILGNISECASQLDEIRVRVTNRAIEYHSLIHRTLVDINMIPIQIIQQVTNAVAPQLVKNPEPKLFRLVNPKNATHLGEDPQFIQIHDNDLAQYSYKNLYFFIHGMDYSGTPKDSFEGMFKHFENAVGMFNNTNFDPDRMIFFLCYDTYINDEYKTIIRLGFESVLGSPVSGNAPMMTLAVFWRELEDRAKIAGKYLLSLLVHLPRGNDWSYYVLSHSLGNFVVGHMAQEFYKANPNEGNMLWNWYSIAAAIPSNAITGSGIFNNAIKAFGGEIKVYHSLTDSVLSTAYILANALPAMGQVGSSISRRFEIVNKNFTNSIGYHHGGSDYYNGIKDDLKKELFLS